MNDAPPLVAVDIGNSSIKLGLFEAYCDAAGLPEPARIARLATSAWENDLVEWIGMLPAGACQWRVASVVRNAPVEITALVAARRPRDTMRELKAGDLPLEVRLVAPERVGIDRLLAAVGANRAREADRAAIIVDLGSAITVDLVAVDGAFLGGAILPGVAIAARALHEQTDGLPLEGAPSFDAPPAPLGASTRDALQSGLCWGAVGAVRELVARLSTGFDQPPEVLVTGGDAAGFAELLGGGTRCIPSLVLAGIVLAEANPT
jgi:type III pantothenate kinase